MTKLEVTLLMIEYLFPDHHVSLTIAPKEGGLPTFATNMNQQEVKRQKDILLSHLKEKGQSIDS